VSINNINKTNHTQYLPSSDYSGYSNPWSMPISTPDGQTQNHDLSWLL
jgi:hypothetical protein